MDYITKLEERCKRFRKIIVEKLGIPGIVDVHNAGDLTAYDFRYLMEMDEIEKSPDGNTFIERADLAAKKKVDELNLERDMMESRDQYNRLTEDIHSALDVMRKYREKKDFENHVVISLKDYEATKDKIERLKSENIDLTRKCDNLKRFIEDVHLPANIIADGRVLHSKSEIMRNPMNMEITYTVKVTVFEGDVKRYGYERDLI